MPVVGFGAASPTLDILKSGLSYSHIYAAVFRLNARLDLRIALNLLIV